MRQIKGLYTITTTFFFIIIVLFIVLAMIYFGSVVLSLKSDINDDLSNYDTIMDVKDRLYYCYGQPLDRDKLSEACVFDSNLIRGYQISEKSYYACEKGNWSFYDSSSVTYIYSYIIPIEDKGLVCPGELKVFI